MNIHDKDIKSSNWVQEFIGSFNQSDNTIKIMNSKSRLFCQNLMFGEPVPVESL